MANPDVRSFLAGGGATVTEPSGIIATDYLVVWMASDSSAVSAPSGAWTKLIDVTWSGGRATVWVVLRGGSAPALTFTSGGTIFGWQAQVVKDAHQTTFLDAAIAGTGNASSTTPSSGTVTTVTANALVLVGIFTGGDRNITVPNTFTEDTHGFTEDGSTAHKTFASPGATGSLTWTVDLGGDISFTGTIAVKPQDVDTLMGQSCI